jgi:hypothetical protein
VDGKKNALIVTDGAESTWKIATAIAGALKNFSVVTLTAGEFSGTHILSADICFFGSEIPNPPSFAFLSTILQHINLAGRPCGIFAKSTKATEYLRNLVHDSELALHPVVLTGEKDDIKKWTETITAQLNERPNL